MQVKQITLTSFIIVHDIIHTEIITELYRNKKLVPWETDGRLPLSGDFRSLIPE